MATKFDAALYKFRTKCPYVRKDLLRWFPGHMNKGIKQIQRTLKSVDCIIEVHDCRIPFTGRNPLFATTVLNAKPHILVLNKKDLTIPRLMPKVKEQLKEEYSIDHAIYTNCKDQLCRGLKALKPVMIDLIKNSNRYNRSEEDDYNVMIIGVPNVGKSSLINMLRSSNLKTAHALQTGAIAGVTRSLHTKVRINNSPKIFMFDTPGILEPTVSDVEMGLKLALCSSLQDHLVGEEVIADYLLYWLNKHGYFKYVDFMGMEEPSDDINEVLIAGARQFNRIRKVRDFDGSERLVPDLVETCRHMVRAFRSGQLGRVLLDVEQLRGGGDKELLSGGGDRGRGDKELLSDGGDRGRGGKDLLSGGGDKGRADLG